MKNIIKEQLYMLPRYSISHFVFSGIALLQIIATYFIIGSMKELVTNAGIFSAMPDTTYVMIAVVYIFTLTAQICLSDFSDKTSYYELMGGHTRVEVYFGRAIPCLVIGTLGALLLFIIPDITATVILGWGGDIPVGQIILRRLLLIFPLFRLCCEAVFISFLMKNTVGVMITGFAVYMVGLNLSIEGGSPWLGITTIPMLYESDIWVTYGLDSTVHFSYGTSLQAETIAPVIVFSVIASAVSIYMGYFFFRNDDMN
ncbi:MAG: hypothetical protein ACI4KH_00165 [Oscillospiraceae bacterium]